MRGSLGFDLCAVSCTTSSKQKAREASRLFCLVDGFNNLVSSFVPIWVTVRGGSGTYTPKILADVVGVKVPEGREVTVALCVVSLFLDDN